MNAVFRSFALFSCITASIYSTSARAELVAQPQGGSYAIRNFSELDADQVADIIQKYVDDNKIGLIFLGESHGIPEIIRTQTRIAEKLLTKSDDCLTVENHSPEISKFLFFPLNERKLNLEQWTEIYRSFWKFQCQLLDVRFNYNGKCFSQEEFDPMAKGFWELSRATPARMYGHETDLAEFLDGIYVVGFNDPDSKAEEGYYTKSKWNFHFGLRNQKHARNIAKFHRAGACRKTIVIGGSGHFEKDEALRSNLVRKIHRNNFKDFPKIQAVQDLASRMLGVKSAFIRLNKPKDFVKKTNTADLTFVFE